MNDRALEFTTEDVTINEYGLVVIDNPEFGKKLISQIKEAYPDRTAGIFDNCNCKAHSLREVALNKVMPATELKLSQGRVVEESRLREIETARPLYSPSIFDNCNCSML